MSDPAPAAAAAGGPARVGPRAAALALMTAAFWGGNPVAVSYSVDTLPPIFVAALRFALATLFMGFWCRIEGSSLRLGRGQMSACLIAGVGLFVQIGLFNLGVAWSSSSHASMMINTFVFWVVVIEHFVTGEDRLTPRKLAGLLLAAGGVALILGTEAEPPAADGLGETVGDTPTLLGDLVLLVSALTLAVKIVYVKHALKRVEPGKLIFWHNAVGVVLFLACSLAIEPLEPSGLTPAAGLAIAYQGVLVGGVCFAVQALLLKRHSATQISIFSFATPLFGVLLGVLLRGDHLTAWLFVSAAAVAAGILLVNVTRPAPLEGTPGPPR